MSHYRVDWEQLRAAAASIGIAMGRMDSELDTVNSQTNALIAKWHGDAPDAYQRRQNQWNSAAAEIHKVLGVFQTAVNNAADIAQRAEMDNVNRVAG